MLLPSILADAPAEFIVLFEHGYSCAALRESTGGCQTAYASADNHDVRRLQCCTAREDECESHLHASETEGFTRTHSCAAAFALQL
jgi:hypothetical protein